MVRALAGTGRPAMHPLGSGCEYDPTLDSHGFSLDLDNGKAALNKSGVGNQALTFVNSNDRRQQDMAQVLQSTYAKIGLNVPLGSVAAADSFERTKDGRINWTLTNSAPRPHPDGFAAHPVPSTGFQNTSHCSRRGAPTSRTSFIFPT